MPWDDWQPSCIRGYHFEVAHDAKTQTNKIAKKAPVIKEITPEIDTFFIIKIFSVFKM